MFNPSLTGPEMVLVPGEGLITHGGMSGEGMIASKINYSNKPR
jgi:hypothetical protein